MTDNRTFALIAGTLLALGSASAQGENLEEIYRLAQQADARLGAAEFQYQATLQARPQAQAAVLPQINAQAGISRKDLSYDDAGPIFKDADFNRKTYGLQLDQSVYNRASWIQLEQADLRIAKAEAEIQAARQELMVRVAEAYFNVKSAEDNLQFARAEKEAVSRQLEQTRQRFEVGMIAVTDVREAEAQFDLAVAQELSATNDLDIARENLQQIVGRLPANLSPLKIDFVLEPPEPANIDKWVETALQNSLALKAAAYDADLAKQEVERRRSGHYPTLGLTASHGVQDDSGGFSEGKATDTTIGVAVKVPLYSGGLTSAQVAEAKSLEGAANKALELQKRNTTQQTRASYLTVLSAISRTKALKQALESTRTAVEATRAGFEVGTRTAVEVLAVERDQYRAQRDYTRARYDYILSTLRLKQAAGILSEDDIKRINQWL